MSLKAELQLWAAALEAYDVQDYSKSLDTFSNMEPNSKIFTNMGLILATVGEHERSVEMFIQATNLDKYLALAYFQCGVSNFLLGRFGFAVRDFEDAWLQLRGNPEIRYEQLGLKYTLYSAEVLFNKGLSLIYDGRPEEGMPFLRKAGSTKVTEEHEVIDEAIEYQGDQFTVFSVPVGTVFRPSAKKLSNTEAKNYLGQAKLVAATEANEAYTEFTGVTRLKQGITPNGLLLYVSQLESETNLSLPTPDTDPVLSTALVRSRTQPVLSSLDPASRAVMRKSRSDAAFSKSNLSYGALRKPLRKPAARANATEWVTQVTPPSRSKTPTSASEETKSTTSSDASRDRGQLMEYYYEYFDSYNTDSSPSPLASGKVSPASGLRSNPERQLMWPARKTTVYPSGPKSAPETSPRSAYSRHASVKKGYSRRKGRTTMATRLYGMARDEEDEYTNWGDYDDMLPEQQKIRVKLHYRDDIRGMALWPDTPFEEFVQTVTKKFKSATGLSLKFQDEDGGIISLKDESDYDLAIETGSPRESRSGKIESKLEIWCEDL